MTFFSLDHRVTLGGVLERFERENMFREDYQQRAIEDILKMRNKDALSKENVLMLQEDKWSTQLREREAEELERSEERYDEMMRIRHALTEVSPHLPVLFLSDLNRSLLVLDQEVVYDSLAMSQGGHLQRRLVCSKALDSDPTQDQSFLHGTNLDEALRLIRKGFESDEGTGRSGICHCSHDWQTTPEKIWNCTEAAEAIFRRGVSSLSEPFLIQATNLPKVDGGDCSFVRLSCQIIAKIVPDPFVLAKFKILMKLKACREMRRELTLELSEKLTIFAQHHTQLLSIRQRLRSEKHPTRGERKDVLQKAIEIESEMSRMDRRLLELGSLICDQGRKEIKYFTKLIPVRRESFLFLLMDARRDPLQVNSDIDKDELSVDWTSEEGVYQDEGASESSTNGGQGLDPGIHIPSWPRHYIDHLIATRFLPHIEAVKITASVAPKRKHYAKFAPMSGQYQYSAKKKGTTNKAVLPTVPPVAHVAKEKTFRDIPGLGKFHSPHASDTQTYQIASETRQWSADLSRWFGRVEGLWRHEKYQLCLSFIQRARHLCNSALRYSVVKATDVRLAKIVTEADVLDLLFLLLCRGGVTMQVRIAPLHLLSLLLDSPFQPEQTDEYVVEENSFPSPVCDAVFGKHPFSLWVYFYLLHQVPGVAVSPPHPSIVGGAAIPEPRTPSPSRLPLFSTLFGTQSIRSFEVVEVTETSALRPRSLSTNLSPVPHSRQRPDPTAKETTLLQGLQRLKACSSLLYGSLCFSSLCHLSRAKGLFQSPPLTRLWWSSSTQSNSAKEASQLFIQTTKI
jgi:hypothetical protein